MYSKERRKQIKEQFTDLPLPKVTKMIGSEWSAMSKEQKHVSDYDYVSVLRVTNASRSIC